MSCAWCIWWRIFRLSFCNNWTMSVPVSSSSSASWLQSNDIQEGGISVNADLIKLHHFEIMTSRSWDRRRQLACRWSSCKPQGNFFHESVAIFVLPNLNGILLLVDPSVRPSIRPVLLSVHSAFVHENNVSSYTNSPTKNTKRFEVHKWWQCREVAWETLLRLQKFDSGISVWRILSALYF